MRFNLTSIESNETKVRHSLASQIYFESLGKRWNKKRFREALLKEVQDGNPLNYNGVSRRLLWAGERLYGNWETALRANGFEYDGIRKRRAWNREKAIDELRKQYRKGADISHSAMLIRDSGLRDYALNYFGSWDAFLHAAGFDPQGVRGKRRWTRDTILKEVSQLPPHVTDAELRITNGPLRNAIFRWFGNMSVVRRILDKEKSR